MIVKSGGGIHCYWVFDQDLTPNEWQPLADRLKEALLQGSLKCDAFCTADSARLLRVPETDTGRNPSSLLR